MAKFSLIQTNFTAGELSPRLMGRVDIARYQNGAKRLENAVIAVQGGVMRTNGTVFVGYTKEANKKTRLIPYVFSRTQAYIIEFGDKYCRIYKDAEFQAEIESPYTEEMLFDINYVQGADTMFLAHPDITIHRLRRVSDIQWTLAPAPFVATPFDEIGEKPDIKLTLNKNEKGEATATLASGFWLAADKGRTLTCGSGIAEVKAVVSATVATIDISIPFDSLVLEAKEWKLEGSPMAGCTASAKEPVGQLITLTLDAAGFRASDVGKYVRVNKGLCKITAFTNSGSVQAEIKTALNAVVKAPAYAWTLEASVWNDEFGYPAAVTLHEQRLYCAANYEKPQTVWMSKTNEYLNFELSTNEDDAAAFTISSDQKDPIIHLSQLTIPMVLSYGGEFTLSGSAAKSAITPTNIQIKKNTVFGCNNVRPVRIANQLLFMQRSGRKLEALGYDSTRDTFTGEDLTALSEHITESGIVDIAYQQEPNSILWLVRSDGQIATLTLDMSQEVIGWSRQVTQGKYRSIATIPSADGSMDDVYCIVERELNGSPVQFIERFTPSIYTHSTKIFSSEHGQTTFTGLEHLEGMTVDIIADGSVKQQREVHNGSISIDRLAHSVEVGLPYTTTIQMLPYEMQGGMGTNQGNQNRVGEAVLRVLNTTGCKVNGDVVPFRVFGEDVLDKPAPTFTGDQKIETLGWNNQITITQDQPLKFHLLAVIRKVTANDG